ncbi:Uncharacterised protein [Mycobacteroides abscessus subsp. abscessus]|nr:Uncharacterised protein [Mycobacteroides abscessus subsp. abscessus]
MSGPNFWAMRSICRCADSCSHGARRRIAFEYTHAGDNLVGRVTGVVSTTITS